MSRNERLAAILGGLLLVSIWAAALGIVTRPGVLSDPQPLPTEATLPTQAPAAFTPQIISRQPDLPLPADIPEMADAPLAAANRVIVYFAPDSTQAERMAFVESLGGTLARELEPLNAAVLTLPDSAALPVSPVIAASEPDYLVTALLDVPTSDPYYADQWGLSVIGAPEAWLALPDDAPVVRVAVIDSGICAGHPDLAGRVLEGYDFVDDDAMPDDAFGHGCAVSGVIGANIDNGEGIAGVAPNAQILPLRVLDAQGVGTYSDVAAAIVYAADAGAQVINLSLGGPNPSGLLASAVQYAADRGALLVAAAGNTGQAGVLYPAAYSEVIAVGSIDPDLQRSSFSTYGPQIGLLAPGRGILTTRRDGSYAALNGTSMAAPHASGAAALLIARGEALQADGGILSLGQGSAVQPTPVPANIPAHYQPLYEKAVREGTVAVIAGLNAAWQPEAQLTNAQAQAQRATIMQVRGALVSSLSSLNAQVKPTSAGWQIPFVALQVDADALAWLMQSPDVVSVVEDMALVKLLARSVPHIDADDAFALGYDGTGQTVAILDDGIDAGHAFFGGRVVAEACFSNAVQQSGNQTVCPNNQNSQIGAGAAARTRCVNFDPCDHGTHVAGIAAGNNGHPTAAPRGVGRGASIIAIQVFTGKTDCSSTPGNQPCVFSWLSDQIDGLQHVLSLSSTYNIAAVNLSLGSKVTYSEAACVLAEANDPNIQGAYSAAINALKAAGIATVAASGNEGDATKMSFPACLPDAVSVGSVGTAGSTGAITDVISNFSNGATTLDLLAPGGFIVSAAPNNFYQWMGGTSMAAPHVTGAWAILKQANPNATVDQVLAALKSTGVNVLDSRSGISKPRIDVDNALIALVPPLVVNSADDVNDGACDAAHCSLREAIIAANSTPGLRETIRFSIGSGPQTITLGTSPLPMITSPVFIDGTTQPGFSFAPLIEIDGTNVTQGNPLLEIGLNIIAGDSTVRGLAINNFGSAAINLSFGGGNVVTGNYLGVRPNGTTAAPNREGVRICSSSNNRVGGTTTAERNVISGNSDDGINLCQLPGFGAASGNVIQGNYIGVNASGNAALGNSDDGIKIEGAVNTQIGGTTSGARNLISGNGSAGIRIVGAASTGQVIQGNYIGTNFNADAALGNGVAGIVLSDSTTGNLIGGTTDSARNIISGNANGVSIQNASGNTIQRNYIGVRPDGSTAMSTAQYGILIQGGSNNLIGGTATGAGNIIANSGQDGVYVVDHNGVATTGNAIFGNRIHNNGGIGIDLDRFSGGLPDGVTANDTGDVDTGGNNLQNFPVLTSASATYNNVTISGTLNSAANTTFRVEFFRNSACDPSGYGEGEFYLGAASVTTNGSGDVTFTTALNIALTAGQHITATATDPGGSTSEFSACLPATLNTNVLVVNTSSALNDGVCNAHCSLPDAISVANSLPGAQTIIFNIPGSGPHTIQTSAMIPGFSSLMIDGTTQPGYNGSPLVILNGSLAPSVNGLTIGSNATVKGLMIRSFKGHGIHIAGSNSIIGGPNAGDGNVISGNALSGVHIESENADNNRVEGNFIGTTANGMAALANGQYGVVIRSGADGNIVTRNMISGNTLSGVRISEAASLSNIVRENLIGANLEASALPNGQAGVELVNSAQTEISGNVIGGNAGSGIVLSGATGTIIQGNLIGAGGADSAPGAGMTPADPIPNGLHGIWIKSGSNTLIGSPAGAQFNVIGFNPGDGIYIEGGAGHNIPGNVIEGNGGLGIDLGPNGVTPNDTGDGDSGANGLQNFPVFTQVAATIDDLRLTGTLNSRANTTYRLDFYNSSACDPTGYGEGRWYLGTTEISTNASGNAAFDVTLPRVVPTGTFMTATATDLAANNTSEFSACAEAILYASTPLNFAVQVLSEIDIRLTWTDNSTDETHWLVERSLMGQNNWTQIASIATSSGPGKGAAAEYHDTAFLCSRSYDYRVRARNQPGGYYSLYTPVQTGTPACPPLLPPDNFDLTPAQRQIDLAWTDTNTTETGYRIDYSPNGGQSWALLIVAPPNSQSYSLTGLVCGTAHSLRVRAERGHDSTHSNYTPELTVSTTPCPPLTAPTSPAASALSRSTAQFSWVNSAPGQTTAFYLERSANGTDWAQFAVVPASVSSVIDSNLLCGQTYQYRARAFRSDDSAFSPYSASASATTSACPVPVNHTVGLYKDGVWQFWQTTQTSQPAISFSFGPAESGWTPVIGDWNGNGTDGIGVYKNGLWLLRSATGGGSVDSALLFGPAEPGWQPIVGDWDGDGVDGIGVYKNGVWLLRQTPTSGQPDITFTFGPAEPGWRAVAGDWNGGGTSRVGLFKDGVWLLSSQLPAMADVPPFVFGQPGWIPVAGDWDQDSRETAGIYKDGLWQLRNSSSGGLPDAMFGMTIGGGWYPLAIYEGGMGGLTVLAIPPDAQPTPAPVTAPPVVITPDPTATATPVPEITEEPLVEATEEPAAADAPEATAEAGAADDG